MTEKKKPKNKKRNANIVRIFAGIVASIVVLAIIGTSIAGYYVFSVLQTAPTLNIKDFASVESSQIFDKDGVLIADIGEELRTNVTYADLPQVVIDAFISIEDSRYFVHNGFDLPRFTMAAIKNLQASVKTGSISFEQGGSTFTMQLIKNTYFTTKTTLAEKSVPRKLKEIYLALQLDQEISKKRVLELYLNKINFGASTTRGIQNAARFYFGKDVTEINLNEAAFLAGVINGPAIYSPFGQYGNITDATKRRNEVLNLMVTHGYITQDEATVAKSVKLEDLFASGAKKIQGSPYQAYIDAVITEVETLTGLDPYTSPMKIYTSMDRELQDVVEKIQNGTTKLKWPNEIIQTAIVSMNNKTGEITALGGGRFYNGERLFNRATSMKKQPGSSLKPVMPYALAFEYLGYSTQQVILDEPYNYRGTDVIVTNFDEKYNGEVTLSTAIARSLNIPSLKTLQAVIDKIGSKKVIAYLNSVGFTQVTSKNFDIGYAIGGSSFEVTPVQEAGAHAAIVNGGNYIQPHTITRVEFKDGSEPLIPAYASTKVISADAAYLSTNMMNYNVVGPYYNYMQILKRPYEVYAKTGTSDWGDKGVPYGIPKGAIKDRWMVASTSQFTTAVWVGYDKAVKGQTSYINSTVGNMNIPGNINSLILNELYRVRPKPASVKQPAGVTSITHVLGVYPYVAPIANMNPKLIVTALIKKDFAQLGTLVAPVLSNPTSFTQSNVDSGSKKQFTFTLNPYPTPESLVVAPPTLKMSLTVGGHTVSATGVRLYDPSWIFGAVKYKVRISIDGTFIAEYAQGTNVFTVPLDVAPGSTVHACGFFGYDISNITSTEICTDTVVSDVQVSVPNNFTGRSYDIFRNWLSSKGKTNQTVFYDLAGAVKSNIGNVKSIDPAIEGTTMTMSALIATNLKVTIYDDRVNPYNLFVGKSIANARTSQLCGLIDCVFNPDIAAGSITQVKVGGVTVANTDTYLVSELANGGITLVTTP
jgi:penicillin-binding protein 1A